MLKDNILFIWDMQAFILLIVTLRLINPVHVSLLTF